jgi:trimethylamine--corrinoid protein Co-methyltransferase
MHSVGLTFHLLSQSELERFHASALRILAEMGMQIDNHNLLLRLSETGLLVDPASQRVRFPSSWIEEWLTKIDKFDWEDIQPRISASAGIYHSLYHDPELNQLVPWNEERLANYISLARSLPNIGSATLLGNRLHGLGELEPLYERFYAWKWGAQESGSILQDELCPHLYNLYEAATRYRQIPLENIFHATVYLVPALKLGKHEAYQVDYFMQRGLRVNIGGSMLSMGANAPVTMAGSVTLNLAEQIALNILNSIFWGDRRFILSSSIAPLDMRTTIRPFGRPEMAVANLLTAQLAQFYQAEFSGHAGLTDAKLPSVEAGYQKALSGVATLLAGGSLWMDAGLLAIDEVCSPAQMVLDNEFLGALKHFSQEFNLDEEAIGLDMIIQAGPGGSYVAEMHTARHFRHELWQPSIWSREMLAVWRERGEKLDVDKAREIANKTRASEPMVPQAFLDEIEAIIHQASLELRK